MKIASVALLVSMFMAGPVFADEGKLNYKPPHGYVPDEKTAIAIAVAVWSPIYGEKNIQYQKPFHATTQNGVWFVHGSLPEGFLGGVAEAEISQDDGRILRVSHGK